MDTKITLVALDFRDIDESVCFYREGLSFPMQDSER